MRLRNWEHSASSGLPISGAVVEARVASLVSPNTDTVIASTTTDTNGMWEFTSLPDQATDIKVISGGNIWWHKGLTRHNIDELFYNTPTPRTDNFLRNGGFDVATASGIGPWTATSVASTVLDTWTAQTGAGSSAVISRDATIHPTDSTVSAKAVHSKVAGSLAIYQGLPIPASFRGKAITVSAQVRQGLANSALIQISDDAGATNSATSATTGAFVTLTATRTISATTTFITVALVVTATDTIYFDNVIVNLGSQPATYQPEYWFPGAVATPLLADAGVTTAKLADLAATTPKIADLAITTPKIAAASVDSSKLAGGAALTNLGFTPVNKVGDSMSGQLSITLNSSAFLPLILRNQHASGISIAVWNAAGTAFDFTLDHTAATFGVPVNSTVDFQVTGISVRNRSIHTGTQPPSSISPQGAGSALDADTVDGQHAAAFSTVGHTHPAPSALVTSGTYVGNGLATQTIPLGISAKIVFIVDVTATGNASMSMAIAGKQMLARVSGASNILTGDPTVGISGTDFVAGAGAGTNTSGKTYTWIALG